ncbi:MAG TPA: rhodanese-like domain-containing protein [Candidatus Acidoferrales bacterium]|nr:rhodanese-like domain-containing protein [Candidatus Acidoferrales bacterium]
MTLFRIVSADWVERHLDSPEFVVLDPRSAVRYMAGHPKNAVNLSVAKLRDVQGDLLPDEELARRIGRAGLDANRTPVIYDNADGRNAAFLAWILIYLGRDDVHVMESFWEQWSADGREAFYRPVQPTAREFVAKPRQRLRISLKKMQEAPGAKRIDFRDADEFAGRPDVDERPGHIPGAVNLPCGEMGAAGRLLKPDEQLKELFASRGISANTVSASDISGNGRAIAYCRTGVRAALGFLALTQLGFNVSLYDGSYAEWARSGLPVENTLEENEKGEGAHV